MFQGWRLGALKGSGSGLFGKAGRLSNYVYNLEAPSRTQSSHSYFVSPAKNLEAFRVKQFPFSPLIPLFAGVASDRGSDPVWGSGFGV